jgi:hypothetical protein
MEGELTGEISKKKVRMINTQKNEIPMALNHSITVRLFGINLFKKTLFKNLSR